MIYQINEYLDALNILMSNPTGLIIFDLSMDLDASNVTIAIWECPECETKAHGTIDFHQVDKCIRCGASMDGSIAVLIIQGSEVLFACHREVQYKLL